jgi:glycosyltransferase involved in cell wall biosynthesis
MVGLGTLFAGTVSLLQQTIRVSELLEDRMKDYDMVVERPISKVSILMPAYNEERFIIKAASSIRCQSVVMEYPEMFEFIVIDNGSKDRTMELALPFADKVVQSPRGKLSARNYGTNMAEGDIIVAVDADVFYPFGWLNTLLKPFLFSDIDKNDNANGNNNEQVVGTSGTILDYHFPNMPRTLFSIGTSVNRVMNNNQMYGANSAYLKDAFYEATNGVGFDENINQFDVKEMVKEEEKGFGRKLSMLGKVKYVFNAGCVHLGGMKTGCRMGFADRNSPECKGYGFGIDRFG